MLSRTLRSVSSLMTNVLLSMISGTLSSEVFARLLILSSLGASS